MGQEIKVGHDHVRGLWEKKEMGVQLKKVGHDHVRGGEKIRLLSPAVRKVPAGSSRDC